VRWRGVAVYLALAFGLSWATQVAVALATREAGGLGTQLGFGILGVAVLLMWPPAIGAIVARQWVERSGFRDAGLRRGPRRYVFLAWALPPLLTLLTMLISLPIYPFDAGFSRLREMMGASGAVAPLPLEVVVVAQVIQGLTIGTLVNCIFTFGEEFGWRGYLLPRLMTLLGPWPGLLAHGAIWGLWHAPLIGLTGYNYPQHPLLGIPAFVVFCALLGVVLGWLRLAANSVLPPTVGHASLNAIAGLPLLVLTGVDTAVAGVLWSPVGWVVLLATIGVLQVTGALPRALATPPPSTASAEDRG